MDIMPMSIVNGKLGQLHRGGNGAICARRSLSFNALFDQPESSADALNVWKDGMTARQAADAVADTLAQLYRDRGMPPRLRDADVKNDDLPDIAAETVKNFNARASLRSPEERIASSLRLLEAAW